MRMSAHRVVAMARANQGRGYLIIQAYSLFDMPPTYALLIDLLVIFVGANALRRRLAAWGAFQAE